MKDVSKDDLEKRLPLVAKKDSNHVSEIIIKNSGSDVVIGSNNIIIIAGPCAVESHDQLSDIANNVKNLGAQMLRGGVFKPLTFPYPHLFNYPDLEKDTNIIEEKLKYSFEISKLFKLPFVTEVMHAKHVNLLAKYAAVLQIGARNMQNIELLIEAAKSKKPVLLKRHPGMSLRDFLGAAEWILANGNPDVILCERGISAPHTHNPNSRFLPDIASIPYLKRFTHLPVIYDPSHSTFDREIVSPMARASIAAGADGIIIDVHPIPEKAAIDPLQALNYQNFDILVKQLKDVARSIGRE